MLGLQGTRPLEPAAVDWLKLVGFVPADDADLIRKALFSVGAGVIGAYEHCSWGVEGQGTFLPTDDAAPTIGEVGRDETVDELRLEVVFPRKLRRRVIAAYVGAHPYEEPAFDVVCHRERPARPRSGPRRRAPGGAPPRGARRPHGGGARAAVAPLRRRRRRLVRRVAVLPGSGGAAIGAGVAGIADVLVTGDVKYHDARAALAAGLSLVDAPHEVTEEAALLRWCERLEDVLREPGVRLHTHRLAGPLWSLETAASAADATQVVSTSGSAPLESPEPIPSSPNAGGRHAVLAGAVCRACLIALARAGFSSFDLIRAGPVPRV